jgi:putative ABC transport system permease protein
MLKLAPLILRNVLRNRRRSLLTLASTVVSLALLSLVVGMYQNFFFDEQQSPNDARRIICRHRVSLTNPLPASHQARIKSIPGVEQVSAWSWFQGVYKEPRDFFARFAVDPDVIFNIRKDWSMPSDQIATFIHQRTACAIGDKIAKQYDIKIGDRVTIVGDIYNVTLELTCVGIFKHGLNGECLVFHRDYLRELLNQKDPGAENVDTVGTYAILADTPENVPRIAKAIDTMFENSPYPTRTESEKEFGRSFLAFLGNIKLFLAAVCGAVTFTILLVSANTVAMAVRERTREMAILRTLGYAPAEILQLVLGEALFISLVGGLLGLLVGSGLAKGMQGAFGFTGIHWQAALVVLGMAATIGLIAALVPAMIASRKNVVESLRFTG